LSTKGRYASLFTGVQEKRRKMRISPDLLISCEETVNAGRRDL